MLDTTVIAKTQLAQLLHVGCGTASPAKLHPTFHDGTWQEVRLDIDPAVNPDVVASITDMNVVEDASYDAVFSSHNLEHLYPHEVPLALREFRRVLKPDGFALITLPDLQSVAQQIAEGRLDDPAYVSPMGPVAPLDILYGFRPSLACGNLFMAHRTGFTGKTLGDALLAAGFAGTLVQRHPSSLTLWAVGFCRSPDEAEFRAAQQRFLPLKLGEIF
jgi:SAM-dependent methyltransferase